MNQVDHFEKKSKSWDMSSTRVTNAKAIADGIIEGVSLEDSMTLMDFGAGTGLLSYFIAPKVEKIIAIDNSPSMLEKFNEKQSEFACNTETIQADLSVENLDIKVDGVISSMTIHHLLDTQALFDRLYSMLHDGGFIAIADLDTEDGTFHSDNAGVFHYGFDREELKTIAQASGFKDISFQTVSHIKKPHKEFTVFLMIASI